MDRENYLEQASRILIGEMDKLSNMDDLAKFGLNHSVINTQTYGGGMLGGGMLTDPKIDALEALVTSLRIEVEGLRRELEEERNKVSASELEEAKKALLAI